MALTKITPQMFDTSAAGHDFNVDNGTFFVDASADRVGIGTSSPSNTLDVVGGFNLSGNIFVDTNVLATDVTNNRVGIGTATPSTLLDVNGALTAGSVAVDNITIDGTEIDLSSGSLTLDVATNIILDSGNAEMHFAANGTVFGKLYQSGNDFYINNPQSDEDIIFTGNDGGSTITALTLDMSEAGAATFNSNVDTTTGEYKINGVTVINSSRELRNITAMRIGSTQIIDSSANLSNIGTISSGAITSTGTLASSDATFTASSAGAVALNIKRSSSSGRAQIALQDEGGNNLWRIGATGPGSTDFAFFDGSDNVLVLSTNNSATFAGTIATGGITINGSGSTISDSSDLGIVSGGDLTLDVTGDIILDADGGDIKFKDGGTHIGTLGNSSNDLFLFPLVSNADFKIFGNDGGSTITALTLDMSAAGKAIFNAGADFHNVVDISAGTNLNLSVRQLAFNNFSNEGVGITFSRTSSDADLMAIGVVDTSYLNIASRSGIIFSVGGSSTYAATSAAVNISSVGDVGIGQSNPSAKLDVVGGGSSTGPTLELNSSTSTTFNHAVNAFNSNLTAGENNIFIIGKEGSTKNSGYIGYKWNGAGSNTNLLTFGHWANDNIMNLTADGKLGIGTQSPSVPLHIQTNDSTTNTTVTSLMITNLSTGTTTTGFGGEIRFQAERNNGVNQNTGGIRSVAEVNSGSNISSGMAFDTSTAGVNYEKMRINSGQGIFCKEVSNNGDYSMYIGSICAGGNGNRYAHVQLGTAPGDMYWVEVVGFDYSATSVYGRAGGYVYNFASQTPPYSSVYNGSIVNQFQNTSGYIEIVIDTGSNNTGNRWGSYVLRGGTDTITASGSLEILQYSYASTAAKVY